MEVEEVEVTMTMEAQKVAQVVLVWEVWKEEEGIQGVVMVYQG